MDFVGWTWLAAAFVVALAVGSLAYLSVVLVWSDRKTQGLGYFGLAPEERTRFHETLRRHAFFLRPVLALVSRPRPGNLERATLRVRGIAGPRGTCTEESFAAAMDYGPRPDDVFVVTQMKCGTTWMQYLIHEVLMRGSSDLAESGRALYAVSPWLESVKSVPVVEAPRVGEDRPRRIIKTHLPAPACPRSDAARYIYVTRHPGSCFASCVDFLAANMGRLKPDLDEMERWFCSPDRMWWGTWPDHVGGWWRRAQTGDNVLWVSFEDMKVDLESVVHRVATFLDVPLRAGEETSAVVRKCSFEHMRAHAGSFEMHPPHLLASEAQLLVRGSSDRYGDLPSSLNERIVAWSAAGVEESGFPMRDRYPTRLPT